MIRPATPSPLSPALPSEFRRRALVVALASLGAATTTVESVQAQAAATLEPVVITGSTREQKLVDAPYAIQAVDAAALRSAGPMVNLSESLVAVPGLNVANRNNYAQDLQISSRGFGARAGFGVRGLRLYTDGIPASMPDGQGQVAHFDLAGADRVEVLRGPFSALYGNSSGGVIALYSAPITKRSVEAGLDFGSFGLRQQRLSFESPLSGGFSAGASLSNLDIDGFRPHSDAERRLANVRLAWKGGSDQVTLSMSDQHQRANDPLGLTRTLFEANPDQTAAVAISANTRKTIDQTQAGVNWQHRVGGDSALLSTQLSAYLGQRSVVQFLSTPIGPQAAVTSAGGVIDFDRRYDGLDGRLTWTLGEADLVTGVAIERQRDDRKGYNNFVGTTQGVVGTLRRDEINRATTRDAYAQVEWPLAPRWQLSAGLRSGSVTLSNDDHYPVTVGATPATSNLDDSGSLRFRYTNPLVGVRYQADSTLTLHAAASRGHESPTLGEVAYRPDGLSGFNTSLKAQTSRQFEVGAKWRPGAALALDAALFHIATDNEIGVFSNSGGRSTYQNVGETLRQGAEVAAKWRARPTLHGQVALTALRAVYRGGQVPGVPDGNRVAGTQPASAYADIAWSPWTGGEWALEWRGQGRTALNDANLDVPSNPAAGGGFAAGWSVFNLRFQQRWAIDAASELELLARLDNLADQRYAGSVIVAEANQRYFEPAPGRNGLLSLRYRRHL